MRHANPALPREEAPGHIVPVFAYLPNSRATLQLIARIKAETDLLLEDLEAYELCTCSLTRTSTFARDSPPRRLGP